MTPPRNIAAWMERTYPKPRVDQEWLQGCCDWIIEDKGIDPERDQEAFTRQVELQLMSSDLRDSMSPSTGLAPNSQQHRKFSTGAQPILVEITALTEIGHSAFSLLNTRQARLEREDLAGLVQREREQQGQDGSADNAEDDGPIPNYPRQMLELEISDGTVSLPAIEYRKIPDLCLGDTQLGCKILLKNVIVRNGIAFLEPSNTVVKGGSTYDREKQQDSDFLRASRRRMGYDEDPPEQQRNAPDPDTASTRSHIEEHESLPSTSLTMVPSRYFVRTASPLVNDSPTQTLHRVLSPVGPARNIQLIDISDISSDSLLASSTSIVPPQHHPSISSETAMPSTGLSGRKKDEFDLSSDFVDEAFLDELDKVEKAAIAATSALPASASQTRELSGMMTTARRDVIVIDDDDECKENIPIARVPVTHITNVLDADVIDLSE